MTWNYRVRKRAYEAPTGTVIEYGIVEYYNNPKYGWTINNIAPSTYVDLTDKEDSEEKAKEELRWSLTEMLKALDRPVVDETNKE